MHQLNDLPAEAYRCADMIAQLDVSNYAVTAAITKLVSRNLKDNILSEYFTLASRKLSYTERPIRKQEADTEHNS